MNPHFFFEGNLSREESVSAFLAVLLEQHSDFRSFLFNTLEVTEPQGTCRVTIEEKEVDIRLDYPSDKVTVLIENKLRPGSLQVNQLVRYYQSELKQNPDSRILSILAVPSEGTGTIEASRLVAHDQFRPSDLVYKISWRLLTQFCDLMQQEDPNREFVRHGFASIFKIIESAAQEKYPLLGGREIAHEIAQHVLAALKQDFPDTRFGFWRGKDFFDIYTIGTDITVYVDLAFRVEDKSPYKPLEIHDGHHIIAILRTQFGLSAKGKRNAAAREKWVAMCQNGAVGILSSGKHKLEGRWFKHEVTASGDATLVERQLADMGRSVISNLHDLL